MPSPESFWHRLLDWLTRSPLSVRLLEAQLEWMRKENQRLTDLLTQAWETRGVIPIQGEHRESPPPPQVQRKSYAEIEADLTRQDQADYEEFVRAETKRLERVKEVERF